MYKIGGSDECTRFSLSALVRKKASAFGRFGRPLRRIMCKNRHVPKKRPSLKNVDIAYSLPFCDLNFFNIPYAFCIF